MPRRRRRSASRRPAASKERAADGCEELGAADGQAARHPGRPVAGRVSLLRGQGRRRPRRQQRDQDQSGQRTQHTTSGSDHASSSLQAVGAGRAWAPVPSCAAFSRRRTSAPGEIPRGRRVSLTPPLRGANIGYADIISQRERGRCNGRVLVVVRHAAAGRGRRRLLRLLGHQGIGRQDDRGHRGRVLQRRPGHLGRVDDARLDQVAVLLGRRR